MWLGYQSKQPKFAEIANKYQESWQYIHTSGHAYLEHLQSFAGNISPKVLVPIHTLNSDKFSSYFDNVHIVENGESIVCE